MQNKLCHWEISTKDKDKATNFYTSIFNWTIKWDDKMDYGMIDTGTPPGGGLFAAKEDMPLGVSMYILVESIDDTLKKIETNGGKIIVPKSEIPTIGWFSHFADPEGNVLGIYEEMKK